MPHLRTSQYQYHIYLLLLIDFHLMLYILDLFYNLSNKKF